MHIPRTTKITCRGSMKPKNHQIWNYTATKKHGQSARDKEKEPEQPADEEKKREKSVSCGG